jgi:hypothetical protein
MSQSNNWPAKASQVRPPRLIDVASRVNACDIPDKYDALKLEYADKVPHVADQSRLRLKRV